MEVACPGTYYYIRKWKGIKWLKLFEHHFSEGFFYSNEECIHSLAPRKYSILDEITDSLKYNNSFEFFIEYPSSKFHWKQDKNPVYENEVLGQNAEGFYPIDCPSDMHGFGGLARTTLERNDYNISSFLKK